jgi:hypothetical protein
MLRPIRPHASVAGLLSATMIGFTAIVLLGRAGELVRPYLIAQKERVPFPSQVAAWVLERIYDLLMVLVIFGFRSGQSSLGHPASEARPGHAVPHRRLGDRDHRGGVCIVLLVGFGKYSHIARKCRGLAVPNAAGAPSARASSTCSGRFWTGCSRRRKLHT